MEEETAIGHRVRGDQWQFVLSSLLRLADNACVSEQTIIEVSVNGEPRQISAGSSVTDLVSLLELTAGRLAIELNLSIVPRATWPETKLQAGDKLEIVHFVGGG